MTRMKSLFYRKLNCLHCKGFFKRKVERGKIKYCCTNYDVGKCTKRVIIEEEFLINCLEKRYQRKLTEDEIRELVKIVTIEDKLLLEIELSDGSESILFSRNHIRY